MTLLKNCSAVLLLSLLSISLKAQTLTQTNTQSHALSALNKKLKTRIGVKESSLVLIPNIKEL